SSSKPSHPADAACAHAARHSASTDGSPEPVEASPLSSPPPLDESELPTGSVAPVEDSSSAGVPVESDASPPEEDAASVLEPVLPSDSISSSYAVPLLLSASTPELVSLEVPFVLVPAELLPSRVPAVSVPEVVVSVFVESPPSSPQATRFVTIVTRHILVRNDIRGLVIDTACLSVFF